MSTNNTQVGITANQRLRDSIDFISRALTELENVPDSSQTRDDLMRAQTILSFCILAQIIIAADHVNAESECSICTEPFQVGDDARQMPCHESHIFHARCLLPWLKRRNTCPTCRTRLVRPINATPDSQNEEFVTSRTSNNG
ncbi:E3 ubiquitin-protein ligase RDUF1-like [Cryptomeria japonica]|uniref:E3 ubiquitin-protein ligase RDUF1-like n=1 Tax=Cryptomeria japonica TaxID=3369 RepID=UPI0025ABE01E|nr:E3 ubiquitin-protein ligase RDUF1-like [Cryptomeria japonica]XP_059067107.1 E3 ubiquitin-protein ligase RDUF1-like [Cryptomeria japonica]